MDKKRHIEDKVLILLYVFLPVYWYGFEVLDANGPKFLLLSVLNLLSFAYFFMDKSFRQNYLSHTQFFKSLPALPYIIFLLFSLLSFVKAINLTESILTFTKAFTVFFAFWVFRILFLKKLDNYLFVIVALNFLLISDSLLVFYYIGKYISGELGSIRDISSVYSHKNVLSAAFFIKLPASIFLVWFSAGWKRILGYAGAFLALISILFLSARAFYLGLVLLFILLLIFSLVRFRKHTETHFFRQIMLWFAILGVSVITYTLIQLIVFPKKRDVVWNTNILDRITSISQNDSSTMFRVKAWNWSLNMIASDPLLGIGTGNWKVNARKYENEQATEFLYAGKSHNDFLENTAETGIPGGFTFLVIFVMVAVISWKIFLQKGNNQDSLRMIFLPAFGLFSYSIDALFNFPSDRPEIQILFALYLALASVASDQFIATKTNNAPKSSGKNSSFGKVAVYPLTIFTFSLLSAAVWILYQNNESLRYQLVARNETLHRTHNKTADYFLKGLPGIPNLTCIGEPIVITPARYLIQEERYREAIGMLRNDRASPFDCRVDYYLSLIYDKLGIYDSAVYFGKQALEKMPFYGNMVKSLSARLFLLNKKDEAKGLLKKYLARVKSDPQAYITAAQQHWMDGEVSLARQVLEAGMDTIRKDTSCYNKAVLLDRMISLYPFHNLFDSARIMMTQEKYPEALGLFRKLLKEKPRDAESWSLKGLCNYYCGNYRESIADINQAFERGLGDRPDMINLVGINNHLLGNRIQACQAFKAAMDKGNPEAANNYRKYCLENSK